MLCERLRMLASQTLLPFLQVIKGMSTHIINKAYLCKLRQNKYACIKGCHDPEILADLFLYKCLPIIFFCLFQLKLNHSFMIHTCLKRKTWLFVLIPERYKSKKERKKCIFFAFMFCFIKKRQVVQMGSEKRHDVIKRAPAKHYTVENDVDIVIIT